MMDREDYEILVKMIQDKDELIVDLQERLIVTSRKLSQVENELADALEIIEEAGL